MSLIVKITDGTDTIDLSGSGCFLSQYVPSAPSVTAKFAGDDYAAVSYQNVTETIEFAVEGATSTVVQSKIDDIQRMIRKAALRRSNPLAYRVWLLFNLDGTEYRSEILYGKLTHGPDAIRGWASNFVENRLSITRRPYWEGPETEISFSTNTQGAATGGRTVGNGDDGWARIAASQITGTMPAPLHVEYTNTSGGSVEIKELWLANNVHNDPATFAYYLTAASVDNGAPAALSWSSTPYDQPAWVWGLASSQLSAAAGMRFRLLARFTAAPSQTIFLRGRSGLYEDPLFLGTDTTPEAYNFESTAVMDLGSVSIPPGGVGDTIATDSSAVALQVRSNSVGSLTLDKVFLFPADNFRRIWQASSLLSVNNETLVDDQPERLLYSLESTGKQLNRYYGAGALTVWPGVEQRIYMLNTGSSGNTSMSASVRLWYRPRRETL